MFRTRKVAPLTPSPTSLSPRTKSRRTHAATRIQRTYRNKQIVNQPYTYKKTMKNYRKDLEACDKAWRDWSNAKKVAEDAAGDFYSFRSTQANPPPSFYMLKSKKQYAKDMKRLRIIHERTAAFAEKKKKIYDALCNEKVAPLSKRPLRLSTHLLQDVAFAEQYIRNK
jgi:hypothetical protein